MPWCDTCAKFWNPPSLREGACPTCGARLPVPAAAASSGDSGASGEAVPQRAPWHFKVLLVGLVIYLGYRAWQGIDWVVHWLHL